MYRIPDCLCEFRLSVEKALGSGMQTWWLNLDRGQERLAKMRFSISGNEMTIYSIMVFPQYRGDGLGKTIIDMLKTNYRAIYADRVRYTARIFWEKMGFSKVGDGRYKYCG